MLPRSEHYIRRHAGLERVIDAFGADNLTRVITAGEIDDLAVGAWILGTGGGGSPYLNHLSVQREARSGRSFELIDADELSDDSSVAVLSTMGAPVVMQERLQDPADVARAVRVMEQHVGRSFDAVMAT